MGAPSGPTARGENALVALAAALTVVFVVLVCFKPSGTVDLWWTLQVGDYIRTQGDVPRTALWNIEAVRDAPYVCHGWLGALAFSAVAAAFGIDAVPALPTLVALVVLALMVATARELGASWLFSVAIANLLVFTVLLRMICRAEIFAYLWFALTLYVIAVYLRRRRARVLSWLVPIGLLWANSHASFLVLFALLPLVAAGMALDAWRQAGFRWRALVPSVFSRVTATLAGIFAAVVLVSLLNPHGPDLLLRVLEPTQADSMTREIDEWKPLSEVEAFPVRFLVPAFAIAAACAFGFRRLSFVSMGIALAFVALSVSAVRHHTLLAIASVPVLAGFVAGRELRGARGLALSAAAAAIPLLGIIVVGVLFAPDSRRLSRYPSSWISADALSYVQREMRGNVLNQYHLGGVLMYFGYPQIRVAIDPRADPFSAEYRRDYRSGVYGGPRATRSFVDRHAIDHIVVMPDIWEQHMLSGGGPLRDFRVVWEGPKVVIASRERGRRGVPSRRRPPRRPAPGPGGELPPVRD